MKWLPDLGSNQALNEMGVAAQALLLRDGDVLSPVPEPSAGLLAGAGLLMLGWLQRRRGGPASSNLRRPATGLGANDLAASGGAG